ncbi:hypothetical protein BDW74DRAFT_182923 [Aspergillus multicolor]|uniref:uncharacterized protein n=1 Tax=Aspergillus multicolor TaxID=41759 RepID=UPI003CCD1866
MSCTPQLSTSSGILVGTISSWDSNTGKTSDQLAIYSRQEIYVGRDPRKCQLIINNPFVSNRHLWIYTVIFDQDNPEEVAPLVYAQDISMNGTLWNGYRMGNGRSSFLLSDCDILRLSPDVHLIYRSLNNSLPTCFDPFQALEMRAFSSEYAMTRRKLGSGAYGQVHMAYKKSTGQQFACKIVNLLTIKHQLAIESEKRHGQAFKKTMSTKMRESYIRFQLQGKLEQYHREAKILETLQHPNIIGLEKVIISGNTIYMFQDLLTAGDLFSYIQYKGGKLPDIEAAVIVRQIVIALDFLHGRNIVHRDLKPDNILMTSRADGCRVVLTDFGCATFVDPITNRMLSTVGTFAFSAPEVVKQSQRGYTKAADLWSLGCLAAVLLTGEPVFDHDPKVREVGCRLRAINDLEMRMNRLNIGERAQNFVFRLLQHDVSKRMDVKQALQHSWFTNPSHKADFEAVYKRSIRDWKPRTATDRPLIVNLESYVNQNRNPAISPSKSEQIMAQIENEPIIKREPADDSTTSGVKSEHSFVAESSSPANVVSPSTNETDYDSSLDSISDMVLLPYHSTTRTAPSSQPSLGALKARTLAEAAIQRMSNDKTGSKRPRPSLDSLKDEAYEETSIPVAGKRQHLYGSSSSITAGRFV